MYDRIYGQNYTAEELKFKGMEYFFHDGERFRFELAVAVLESVKRLRDAILKTTGLRLISSSILITYDSEGTDYFVKLIDFAHAYLGVLENQV